ncbi:hypothetical protein [Candidatus Nitrosocosmicus arcticus]|uniref:hypothetical protein n=1 Tax=Candidatus Nitrosocosmicus arcticus TaxID=2035267 RepID=UPI0011A8D00D|nr:hypothetical protein [Candidatus Nitrosocosmicus arcticus]
MSFWLTNFYPQYNIPMILASGIVLIYVIIFIFASKEVNPIYYRKKYLMLSTMICWLIAEILFGYYSGFMEIDPYPSIADTFYTMGYIFFAVYLFSLNQLYKIERSLIMSSIVTFSLIIIYVLYVSIFIYEVQLLSGGIVHFILFFIYPFFDLYIVAAGVLYYFRAKTISVSKESFYWIFISLFGFFFFIADLTFEYNELLGFEHDHYLFDLLFNIGYLLIGAALTYRIYFLRGRNFWKSLKN